MLEVNDRGSMGHKEIKGRWVQKVQQCGKENENTVKKTL